MLPPNYATKEVQCSDGSRIFPGGRQLTNWDYFAIFFAKTAWKWKIFDAQWVGDTDAPMDPPMQ